MNNINSILKNAFIDAQLDGCVTCDCDFSPEFERNMKHLINSRKLPYKLINTVGKRAAMIAIAVIVALTSALFGVSALRKNVVEPVIEAVQEFFVNAKELLSGTDAEAIADSFPTDVTKIIGTSHISQSEKQYVIDEEEKITAFITLISETVWSDPEWYDGFDEVHTYWTFDFLNSGGDSVLKIEMCNDISYSKAKVVITQNGREEYYYISNKVYSEMLAFTNRKFYLHDAVYDLPDKEISQTRRNLALDGVGAEEADRIKDKIRDTHYKMEKFLLENVSLLKESDSIYWQYVLSGEEFTDPIAGYTRRYNAYETVISDLEFIKSALNNKRARADIERAMEIWKNAVENHDLEGLFKAHEYVHDYDYFLFNYPTQYVYDIDADFQGLDDYFGHLE